MKPSQRPSLYIKNGQLRYKGQVPNEQFVYKTTTQSKGCSNYKRVNYDYDTGLYPPVFRTLPRPRPEGLIEGTMDDISIPGGGPLGAGRRTLLKLTVERRPRDLCLVFEAELFTLAISVGKDTTLLWTLQAQIQCKKYGFPSNNYIRQTDSLMSLLRLSACGAF